VKKPIDEIMAAIEQLTPEDRAELKERLARSEWWKSRKAVPADRTRRVGWQPDFIIVFDGGSRGNPGPGYGSYLLVRTYDSAARKHRLDLGSRVTSNEAEYDTLTAALKSLIAWIGETGGDVAHTAVEIRGDSQLVLRQVGGTWRARNARMLRRRDAILELLEKFGSYRLTEQPREESVRLLGH
jgi:ribonuclease HI